MAFGASSADGIFSPSSFYFVLITRTHTHTITTEVLKLKENKRTTDKEKIKVAHFEGTIINALFKE